MTSRTLQALASALLICAAYPAQAEDYYYRNIHPGAPASAPTKPADGGTKDPMPTDPTPPVEETGPLRLTQSPTGDINVSYQTPVNAVFRASGGCSGSKSFSLSGVTASALAGYGLSASASGNDYVISGKINRIQVGGTFNVTVTVRDSCYASQSVQTFINFNPPPADYDPPWDLHLDGTVGYVNKPFAFYPDIRNNSSSDPVDTTGFTYSLGTLDPAGRPIPPWLKMDNPSTGVVTGTAPANGSYGPYYITVKAPNGGPQQSVDFVVGITSGFTFTGLDGTGATQVSLTAGQERSLDFLGTGGCSINRYFAVDSNTPLPNGMSLVYAEDRWTISGTPASGGTWPVRLAFTDYACGPSQFFPVTFTVTGAPVAPLTFSSQAQATPVGVGADPDTQYIVGYLDNANGAPWSTLTCQLLNGDGTPANLSWAKAYQGPNYICAFYLNPTDPAQAGTYTWKLRATTDTRGTADSDPVTVTVTPTAGN